MGARGNNLGTLRESWILHYIFSETVVADPGEPPPHPAPPPPVLFLDQTEAQRAEKKQTPALSQGLDDRPFYLKAWIHL